MSRPLVLLLTALMAVFFGCFFVWPLWVTVRLAFMDSEQAFTWAYVGEVFANPLYRQGLLNSFYMGAWSTLGCLLVAVPLALLHGRYAFPGRSLLHSLVLAPLILPPFVGAIGIKIILGQAGALNAFLIQLGAMDDRQPVDWLGHGQLPGIVLMNVLHLYPILYLNVVASLARVDPAMAEAAASLGCPPWRRFWRITLPLIRPGVFAGGTLVFIWAFTELGVPLVFDYDRVTSVQIFRSLNDLSDNPFPYALVVVMLLFSTGFYLLGKQVFGRSDSMVSSRPAREGALHTPPRWLAWACTAAFASIIFLAVLPHLGVLFLSLAHDWYATVLPQQWTLDHYRQALGHELTLPAIANSLKYSVLAISGALVLGVAVAYVTVRTRLWVRHGLDAMAMLPLAVPGVVMAFGYLAMTRPGRAFDWLILGEDPVLILIIAYAVRRLPFIVRSATAGLEQISPGMEEAARNLGATPWRTLRRITLPLLAPSLLAGGLLAFAFAMLEVGDSMVLAQQSAHFPITKAIYFLVMALGNGPNLAAALGVWAMVFLALCLAGAGFLVGRKLGALFR